MIKFPSSQVPQAHKNIPCRHKNITITITINQSLDENREGILAVHSFVYGEDCLALYCIAFALSNTYILLYYPILSNPIRSCLLLYSD